MPSEISAQLNSSPRLVDRRPNISGAELVASLVPPPQFDHASFDSYRPDPQYPSQAAARDLLRNFGKPAVAASRGGFFGLGRKKPAEEPGLSTDKAGVYLDGGF